MSFHFTRKLLLTEWQNPAALRLCILKSTCYVLCVAKRKADVSQSLWPVRDNEWSLVPLQSQVAGTLGSQPTSRLWTQKLHLNPCCPNAVLLPSGSAQSQRPTQSHRLCSALVNNITYSVHQNNHLTSYTFFFVEKVPQSLGHSHTSGAYRMTSWQDVRWWIHLVCSCLFVWFGFQLP